LWNKNVSQRYIFYKYWSQYGVSEAEWSQVPDWELRSRVLGSIVGRDSKFLKIGLQKNQQDTFGLVRYWLKRWLLVLISFIRVTEENKYPDWERLVDFFCNPVLKNEWDDKFYWNRNLRSRFSVRCLWALSHSRSS